MDFGISGLCKGEVADKNEAATLKYMTPEMISTTHSTANPSLDVWAIGIMIYSMLFNKSPFNGNSKDEIKHKITNSTPTIPKRKPITQECHRFMMACLNKNPAERITIEEMLDDKWMNLSDDKLEDLCE